MGKPFVWVLEEKRNGKWVPACPGNNETEVMAATKKTSSGGESLMDAKKEWEEDFGIPIRAAKYERVDP